MKRLQILNIFMIGHPQLKLYHLKPETLKHRDYKIQHITVYDTSLERS